MQDYNYKIIPHRQGLGFVAEGYDEKGKRKWVSNNHCSEELCQTEINQHKAKRREIWQNAKPLKMRLADLTKSIERMR